MKKIYKYELDEYGVIVLPKSSKILFAGMQENVIRLWAEVNPEDKPDTRDILVIGTGGNVPSNSTYINSLFDGPFVWHLYEKNN